MPSSALSTRAETTSRRRLPQWATSFGPQIVTGLVVGVILGLVARAMPVAADGNENWLVGTVHTIGSSYVKLLTVAVIPLVFTAIVSSIANLREVANAARLAVQTLLWFAITAFIAVIIGIVVGSITQPGARTGVSAATEKAPGTTGSWWAFITGLVPSNFLGLNAKTTVAEGAASTSLSFNVLQLLVVAAAIGIAALKVGAKAEPFLQFNASLLAIVQKVLWWIIRLAPIGTAALIANAVATYGWDAIGSLGWFTAAVYVGLAIVFFVVYPVLIRAHGLSVRAFYSGVWPATQLGFVSRSSIGTLPLTERVTERNLASPRVRVVRRAARVDHQDGRLRRDLSRDRSDLRRRVLRCAFVVHRLPPDHRRVGHRFRRHRGHHRSHGHADAHAVDAGAPPRRCRPAARGRADRRHGPHRGERHRPGARPHHRRQAGGILDEARYNAERTGDPFQDDDTVVAA